MKEIEEQVVQYVIKKVEKGENNLKTVRYHSLKINNFYKTIQSKLHYAITGQTAAEIIYNRVDAIKDNMGLCTWENSPDGKILKSDCIIAKNYLDEKEIKNLNNLVNLFLDIAENNAERKILMYMSN